jgi:predicted neuraminidase
VLIEKETKKKTEGNPVIYYDSETNRLWLFWSTMDRAEYKHLTGGWSCCKLKCKHSDDLGNTWSTPRYLTKTWGKMTRNKPIRLSNGDLLLPIYSEWLGHKSNFLISTRESFALGSHESTWKKIGPVKGDIMQPTVVELEPGHLLAYNRSAKGGPNKGWIVQTESFDYGRHWTKARPTTLPNPDSGCDMVKLKNEHIVLIFNNSPKLRSPLSAGVSEDAGNTWTHIRDLERDDQHRFSYPGVIQVGDGTIWCSYTNKNGMNIRVAHFDEDWINIFICSSYTTRFFSCC